MKYDELLEKCRKICEKVSNSIKKGFDDQPVYSKKYLKTKTKPYDDKTSTTFHDHEIAK